MREGGECYDKVGPLERN